MAERLGPRNAYDMRTATTAETTTQKKSLIPFPAANDDYRYLRKRAAILCAAFNAQPIDVSDARHIQAWNDIVGPHGPTDMPPTAPMIKRPINIDYGTNVNVHPSCFINWGCYIADSPDCTITIGKNTIIGVGARILGVSHPIDWRERQGRLGPSLAGDIKIGRDCFVGAGVTILPGVSIGDGCVIGAGSVVSRSIPAYYVAAGVPARVIRKVASDVADAPGLELEDDDNRELVVSPAHTKVSQDKTASCRQGGLFAMIMSLEWLKTGLPTGLGKPRHIIAEAFALILAASIGYFLGGGLA